MDYKKKYKEALERAKGIHSFSSDIAEIKRMEQIFPELAESEDERIRKAQLDYWRSVGGKEWHGVPVQETIAWLEKQSGQKPFDYENANIQQNDFAPKFKLGDWIVNLKNNSIAHIVEVRTDFYGTLRYEIEFSNGGISDPMCVFVDDECRLWTIDDAKPGDVLVASDGSLFIFAKVKDNSAYHHFALLKDGIKKISDGRHAWETASSCHPATKEQRDTLMKAITDSGYEWDAEKKELRKIENSPVLSNSLNIGKDSKWSEEDEVKVNRIVSYLENFNVADNDILLKDVDWLKSLKQRMEQ